MNEEYIIEFIENKFLDVKRYIDDCFEEQSKNNREFFDNILELVKISINKSNKENNEKIFELISRLEANTNTSDILYKKMINELKSIDNLYSIVKDEEIEENKVLYTNVLKGVKQFSLQLLITLFILLVIIGAFSLVKFIL